MIRSVSVAAFASLVLAALPVVAAPPDVSHDDFKLFLEVRDVLQDERLQKMPEAKRIPAIAQKNYKMKPAALQAVLDKVEAAGGEKGVAQKTKESIEQALSATSLKGRIKEVRVDTGAPHVVTYVTWTVTDAKALDAEAALLALKAGEAGPVTSTFYLTAKDGKGADLWAAKIGHDRTSRIKEDRIADWATTRYAKLFEVEAPKAATP